MKSMMTSELSVCPGTIHKLVGDFAFRSEGCNFQGFIGKNTLYNTDET